MIEFVTETLDRVLDLLTGLEPLTLALAVWLFTALETTALIGIVVPGDAAVLLAGSAIDSPARFALVLLAAGTGTYTGELIGYGIGRAVGPRLRTSRFGRFVGEHRWARTEAYLAGRGAPVLVPIRFVSVLHAVAPVVAGTVRMPLRRFALWAGLGALVWAATYTVIGTVAGTAYRQYGYLGLLTTLSVATGAGAVLLLRRRFRRRRRSADGGTGGGDGPPGAPPPPGEPDGRRPARTGAGSEVGEVADAS